MSDIVEFLRARLHEDEAVAREARARREIVAKYQMIEVAGQMAAVVDGEWGCCHTGEQIISAGPDGCDAYHTVEQVLEPIARIYSEHPDFDPEWAERD